MNKEGFRSMVHGRMTHDTSWVNENIIYAFIETI
jgi:hypothetical protein